MNITINEKSITIFSATWTAANIAYDMPVGSNKVDFIHAPTLKSLTNGYVDFDMVINEATGNPFAAIADLKTFLKENFKSANGSGGAVSVEYIIEKIGTSFSATPRPDSGLTLKTGSDAAIVINAAIAAMSTAGDIKIMPGVYTINQKIVDNGVDGIRIIFSAGAKFVAKNALNNPVIHLTDVNRWEIVNPNIDGNAVNQATPDFEGSALVDGIFIHNSIGSTVVNPNIYNCRRFGVNIDGGSFRTGVRGGEIYNCGWNCITLGEGITDSDLYADSVEVHDCGDVGISTYGIRTKIVNNNVHDITGSTGYNNAHWGIAVETQGVVSTSLYTVIERNQIANVNIAVNIAPYCNETTIKNNQVTGWDIGGTYRPAIWIFSDYNNVQGNTLDNKGVGVGSGITLDGTAKYNYIAGGNKFISQFGVNFEGSASYNTVTGNWSKCKTSGAYIGQVAATGNKIYYNDFSNDISDIYNVGTGTLSGSNMRA